MGLNAAQHTKAIKEKQQLSSTLLFMLSLGKPESTQWNMKTNLYLLQPVSSDWSPQSSTSSHARCCEMHFLLLHLNSSSAQGLGVGPTPVIEEQIKVKTFSSVKQEASSVAGTVAAHQYACASRHFPVSLTIMLRPCD